MSLSNRALSLILKPQSKVVAKSVKHKNKD